MEGWERFVEPFWRLNAQHIATWLNEGLPDDFLRNPRLVGFQHTLQPELVQVALNAVEAKVMLGSPLRCWLEHEPLCGGFVTLGELGSPDRPHVAYNILLHLWELASYERLCGPVEWDRLTKTLHWGGGYGSVPLVLWRLGVQQVNVVDLPACCQLQEVFLQRNNVPVQIMRPGLEPLANGVNLLLLQDLDQLELLGFDHPDLFYSAHALSESTAVAQRYVLQRNFFGARRLLLLLDQHHPDFSSCRAFQEALERLGVPREGNSLYLPVWGR